MSYNYIYGDQYDNNLRGTNYDDYMIGKGGDDKLSGRGGDDYIVGVDPNDARPGYHEVDKMWGGKGYDTFVLGDRNRAYYLDYKTDYDSKGGNDDAPDNEHESFGYDDKYKGGYAVIKDFNCYQDKIKLYGSYEDYHFDSHFYDKKGSKNDYYETKIYYGEDLIGVVHSKQSFGGHDDCLKYTGSER